ncbi:MAG: DnaA/Hda family protein, partial [Planctomycetota bacterium]|nr:DnaA/Hda family protein [Planctomycetota bacterium]
MRPSAADIPAGVRILKALEDQVPPELWSPWFDGVTFVEDAKDLVVVVPNMLHSTFIQQRFSSVVSDVVAEVLGDDGHEKQIHYRVTAATMDESPRSTPGRDRGRIPLNQSLTFDAFVTGPSNQLAHAAAMAVADNPGGSYNPFFLHGSVGLGKTHLLQAVAHRLRAGGVSNVVTISCASFTNDFISALSSQKIDEFRSRYRDAGALLIDDIQFLCDKEATQEEFFHTFNEIYNQERQIFLTSDAPPSQIMGLSQRLVSRFRLGLVVQMDPPDL